MGPKPVPATIHGILIPDEWDERGNIVALAVFTFQEEKIRIVAPPWVQSLARHLRRRVIIDGDLVDDHPGCAIRVHHYRPDDG